MSRGPNSQDTTAPAGIRAGASSSRPGRSAKKVSVSPAGRSRECTVLVAGDWAPIRAFDPVVTRDPAAVYGDMLPVLRAADLRVVNCECALTSSVKPVWKSGAVFKGAPAQVNGLAVVPFDIACLANNHVFDYGVRGFRETLRAIRGAGIRTVGAGLTEEEAVRPLRVKVRGNRISIINISEGEDLTSARNGPGVCGWDLARTRSQIHDAKSSGACVIVIAHCGLEYIPFPPAYVVSAFRSLVEAGADCVIGHHPHVPQGIEQHHGKPIAYSLGNFVFYQFTELYYRKLGFCISLRINGSVLTGFALHPYRISESGLRQLHAREEKEFHAVLGRISRPFLTPLGPERAWHAYLAFYGTRGFAAEVSGILERINSEPEKGAAMFRNRITTPQHSELWTDFLTRVMRGDKPPYSRESYRLVREWFERKA